MPLTHCGKKEKIKRERLIIMQAFNVSLFLVNNIEKRVVERTIIVYYKIQGLLCIPCVSGCPTEPH